MEILQMEMNPTDPGGTRGSRSMTRYEEKKTASGLHYFIKCNFCLFERGVRDNGQVIGHIPGTGGGIERAPVRKAFKF